MKRPNILLFVTDQHRADHLGCYGNKTVRTPNIDSIAARGTLFDRFYVASPVCMANRATMMTGRMPSLHGVRHNGIALSKDSTTFVDLLRGAGYKTALIGKSHLQNMGYDGPSRRRWENSNKGLKPHAELLDASRRNREGRSYDNEWTPYWDADETYAVELPYYGFDHVELCTFHGDQVGGDYSRWLEKQYPGAVALRGKENAFPDPRYVAPQAWRTRLSTELYPSSYIADRTSEWLRQYRVNETQEPFFLKCSFPDPHHPYTPPGKYWDMYDPAEIELPRSFNARDTTDLVRAVDRDTREGKTNREGYTPFSVTEREAREIIALTYGMVSLVDDCVGKILAVLSELELTDETIVIFTSDHGDWMGDHGMMLKGPLHYQGLIRVPFVLADTPDRERLAPRVSHLCGTIDIAATVLDRAGLAPYNGMQGRSLIPQGSADDSRAMVIESEQTLYKFGLDTRFRVRSLVEEDYRISMSDKTSIGELYNLRVDPDELVNLWDDPGSIGLKLRLLERLAREMICSTDEAPLPTASA